VRPAATADRPRSLAALLDDSRVAVALLALATVFLLFHDLGGAALFNPDEGRNAEIAREVLETRDWITPHYNFLPRIEKPMFFYAATALSYKLFGVSEAAARLPSALAALAILVMTYFFVRRIAGERAALWSALALVTAVQFNIFARIVIVDMVLAFFITAALMAFYLANIAEAQKVKRRYYFVMYAAAAGATLVKGPIGFIFPGMIVVAYIAMGRKWSTLKEMDLGWGVLIFLLIVTPWYAVAEARRPGYLAYFLGQEHFARFLTPRYNRGKPWHYFFGVVAVGFFPWTLILPRIAARLWRRRDDFAMFTVLWAVVPFVFFSFSKSKMSEYLLPIYPALAALAGTTLAYGLKRIDLGLLAAAWLLLGLTSLYLFVGLFAPAAVPAVGREFVAQLPRAELAPMALVAALVFLAAAWTTLAAPLERLMPLCCVAFAAVFFLAHRVIAPISLERSDKALAHRSAALVRPADAPVPVVIYDTYLPSLPFYLGIHRPMPVVAHRGDDEILGSFYLSKEWPAPAPGYEPALLTYEEFDRQWGQRKLLVFVKEKRLFELHGAKVLLRADGVALVTNR
jgi:4-amino-4-deoxy-L-arabinose transferase-like glycosyltransferase